MHAKLTKTLIDGLAFKGHGGKEVCWDIFQQGFGVRVYPSGKKSFILQYRVNGKQHLLTLGLYGKITLDQAREIAKKRAGEVADNKSPLHARRAVRKKHEWTVRRAFGDFMRRHAKARNKNWQETERIFTKDILPTFGTHPIDEITKADILKILDKVEERGAGVMANRTLAHVRKFFNWCVEKDLIAFSPAFKVAAPAPNPKRDRVLADHELKEIWQATLEIPYPFGPLARFLILTGQRRGEVATMRWQDVDLKEKLWIIPREFTKADREHRVPLSDMAIEILDNLPRLGIHVFTSAGERPFENFSRDKKTLDDIINKNRRENLKIKLPAATKKDVKIQDWRIHDFRRTAASGMARLKVQPHVVEKILNHSSGIISGVAAVYNRHQYVDEMREALDKWAKHVEKVLNAEQKEKSVLRVGQFKTGQAPQ